MNGTTITWLGCLLVATAICPTTVAARGKAKTETAAPLTAAGQRLESRYAAMLASLQAEIAKSLPQVDAQKKAAFQEAQLSVTKATEAASAAQQAAGKIQAAKGLVDHAKGKWIGGAEKGIAQARAALEKATTAAERAAAQTELAKWQANKEEGLKALKERQAALDKAKADEAKANEANQTAQAALAQARDKERSAAKAFLADFDPLLSSDKLDAKLVQCTVLIDATPRGLAEFAQRGTEQEALVEKLLAADTLMKEMLIAGGAKFGKYGRATEIYAAIRKTSPKAGQGCLQRLALATSLEHAVPIAQSNPKDQTDAPAVVDPVKRYRHYERAYLDGELDPAFQNLSTWEYRMVVNCDAPDEILAWGRAMLRTYRPDHISNPNYGWRYSAIVKTDVRYGSQNVKDDLPSLQPYQNIIKDGGVCGRRAFFGRFILQSFGIPVWGVTQHKHAALSHWTPKGWVVNLGAGFPWSWWDRDEAPRSGSDFLLETQAREHPQEYLKVLRAQWISRVLGEQAYNGRKGMPGGLWSSIGHYQAVVLAAKAIELGPLGQDLAEANAPQEKQSAEQAPVTAADKQVVMSPSGVITIPAAVHGKATGPSLTMKSFSGGMQVLGGGGLKTQYVFEVPQAGKYAVTARVATVQEGQKFLVAADHAQQPVEIAVPYTMGMWQTTPPAEIPLVKGRNTLTFSIREGSRNVAIKAFTLTPVK